jgi:glycogen debranching enzyme
MPETKRRLAQGTLLGPVHEDELTPIDPEKLFGYVSSSGLPEATDSEKRVLKHGNLFAVTNRLGDIWPAGARDLGAYFDDTRMLSAYRLHMAGEPVVCLSSQQSPDGRSQIDLTVTSSRFGGVFGEPVNFLHLRREQLINEVFIDRLTLTNYLVKPVDYWFELQFCCDFADVFEVRGAHRISRGVYFEPVIEHDHVRMFYRGRDEVFYETNISFQPAPTKLERGLARFELSLLPNETATVEISIMPRLRVPDSRQRDARARLVWPPSGDYYPGGRSSVPPAPLSFMERAHAIQNESDAWAAACTRIQTNDESFDEISRQSVSDLHALVVRCGGHNVVSAGIPWYTAPFGRDSLLTAFESLLVTPDLARDAIAFLAEHQGQSYDTFREEAPGKILHEVRRGEMARAAEVPHTPYFGTADATPLWIVLLSEYFLWTGDEEFVRAYLPHAEAALKWIQTDGDPDGDGFIEYMRTSERGLINQGWKDSTDGVPFPDGKPCEPPIALVEVQGYAVDAERRLGDLYRRLGDRSRAAVLAEAARQRAKRIDQVFWVPSLGSYGLALDREKRLATTLTSNAGHLLFSGAVPEARARKVARTLLGPAMWTGWGIRTLGTGQGVYNPLSYHNGTVWPHDNALIAQGFADYGMNNLSAQVLTGLVEAAHHFDGRRLPELFCGLERTPGSFPVHYPVACAPQAWSSAAVFGTLRAALGLFPDAGRNTLRVVDPELPPWLNRVDLLGLRVGRTRLDLRFTRTGERVFVSLLRQEGKSLQLRIDLR